MGIIPASALGSGLEALHDADVDPTQGKPHLVAHAAAMAQRDYLGAIRALHRFFDYNAGERRPLNMQYWAWCTGSQAVRQSGG